LSSHTTPTLATRQYRARAPPHTPRTRGARPPLDKCAHSMLPLSSRSFRGTLGVTIALLL